MSAMLELRGVSKVYGQVPPTCGRSIGYVFQDFNLLACLTARESVALPLELDGQESSVAHANRARITANPGSGR